MLGARASLVLDTAHLNVAAAECASDGEADDTWFAAWRSRELTRVERAGIAYLDYTGAALYPESLVRADAARLERSLLGNPHSQHLPSREATHDAESARRAILDFLHADPAEYAVILTANTSAACRLVAESFPFTPSGACLLTADNHNSVNGMREYARARGTPICIVPLGPELQLTGADGFLNRSPTEPALFAFPAQSNFSGVRHPLSLVDDAQERGWRVFLDAAAFVPTAERRLDVVHPDFVALSVYKMAGYPTGVGALVARHEAMALLQRPSFAGGAVDWVSVQGARHRLARWPDGFEDGTLPFLALGAVAPALEQLRDAGRTRLAPHLNCLTARLLAGIATLRHQNGTPVATIHGPRTSVGRGATVALTLHSADGRPINYWDVEEQARAAGIALRGGCFCNPGCAEHAFGFDTARLAECFDALGDAFSIPALAQCLGEGSVGAVRLSMGLGSVAADVERALAFLAGYGK